MVATMPVTMVMTILLLPLLWLLLFLPLFLRILVFRLLSNSTLIERTPAAAKYLLSIHSVFLLRVGTLIQVQHYQQNPLCLCSFFCVFLLGLSTFYRPLVAFNPNERKPCLCFHRRPCCLLHIAVGTIPPVVFRKTMADSTRRRCPKGPKCQVKTDNSNK